MAEGDDFEVDYYDGGLCSWIGRLVVDHGDEREIARGGFGENRRRAALIPSTRLPQSKFSDPASIIWYRFPVPAFSGHFDPPQEKELPLAGDAKHPPPDWEGIEQDPDFQQLVAAKRRFILPATLFFIAYYFTLPILVGYFPGFMEIQVIGAINLAYLFALSQFFMAWIVMFLYVRAASTFDRKAERIKRKVTEEQ